MSVAQTTRQCIGIWVFPFGFLTSRLMRDLVPNVKSAFYSTFMFISDKVVVVKTPNLVLRFS